MPKMDEPFLEMLATLRDARQSVRRDIRALRQAASIDQRALVALDDSVRNLAAQADGLIVTLVETDAADELVDAAEELADFFEDAREQIETLLLVDRG